MHNVNLTYDDEHENYLPLSSEFQIQRDIGHKALLTVTCYVKATKRIAAETLSELH